MSVPHPVDSLVGRNLHLFFGVGLIVVNTGVVSSMSLVIFFVLISGSSGSDGNGGGDDDDVGDGDNLH